MTLDPDPVVRLSGVAKTFASPQGPVPVLRDVSLVVPAAGSLAIVGESGSGKSTLLHVIAGLEGADAGDVDIAGQRLGALSDAALAAVRRQTVSLVFQQFNLVPSLTVRENIAFQARLAGRYDADRCASLAQRLGLSDLTDRYPEALSGGQQQRVAVGRAMAVRPRLLLADEPTGNLDADTGQRVMDLMLELVADTETALILVTHSPRLAARMDRTVTLSDGRIT